MPLIDNKITAFQKKVVDLTDTPSENMSPADIKAWFDSSPEELRVKHNDLVDDLVANTGAVEIGAIDEAGVTTNVQAQLDKLGSEKSPIENVETIELRMNDVEQGFASLEGTINTRVTVAETIANGANVKSDLATVQANNIIANAGDSNTEIVDSRLRNDGTIAVNVGTHIREVAARTAETGEQLDGTILSKKPSKGIVTFIFDGANASVYNNALSVFNSAGYKACMSIPIENALYATTAGIASLDQLYSLQNVHDWEIISHGYTTRSIANLDTDGARWELEDSKKILNENGFRVNQYLARSSNFGTEHKPILREIYDCGYLLSQAGTTLANNVNVHPMDIYSLTRYSMNLKTLDELKARVDYAEANNGWVVFYEHEVGLNGFVTVQILTDLLAYIATKNIEVLKGSEALAKVSTKLIGQENPKRLNKDVVKSQQVSTGDNYLKNAELLGYGSAALWTVDWGNITSVTKSHTISLTGLANTAIFNLSADNTGADESFEYYQEIPAIFEHTRPFKYSFEASASKENGKIEAVITAYNGTTIVSQKVQEFSVYAVYRKYKVTAMIPGTGVTSIRVSFKGKQKVAANAIVFYFRLPQLDSVGSAFKKGTPIKENYLITKSATQIAGTDAWTLMNFGTTVFDEISRFNTATYVVRSTAGKMHISAGITFDATVVGKIYKASIYINGLEYLTVSAQSTVAGKLSLPISALVPVTGNQTLRIYVSHNAGVNQTVLAGTESFFSGYLIP